MLRVLVVDDDEGLRLSVKSTLLKARQYTVEEAVDGVDAVEKVKTRGYDLVILDVDMPRMGGLDALKQMKEINPGLIVLILTAYANIEDAVRAVQNGAYNYLSKPISAEELLELVDKAINAHNMISNIAASAPVLMEAGKKIIGNTAQMQKVFNIIYRLSKVDTPVLIRGSSGTGKELVAQAIHFNSPRKNNKFVALNCSAIPETLFESELFGHEKGSFTGADQRKIGKFQFAEGGTLFLDEIGDLPLLMQVKLLRVLQEKVFMPVGSNREIQADVRIIAATNRPLEDMIKNGSFREDLFYRLNVMPIFLPALAERKDDIVNLVTMFIKKFNRDQNRSITCVTPDALLCLKRYNWPGNIRELENVIEHAFIMEGSSQITLHSLPEYILNASGVELKDHSSSDAAADGIDDFSELEQDEDSEILGGDEMSRMVDSNLDFNAQKEAFEKEFIIKALKAFKGRINQTALHANIPKKTLLRKIEKYGINAKDYSN